MSLEMRNNIDKLINDLEEDNESLEVISNNLKNLEFILNRIVYLKSHAINMVFKDAVILKKEQLEEKTIQRGIEVLKNLMEKSISQVLN